MTKKLFAVTNIKGEEGDGAGYVEAGSEVDHSKFTKEQLRELLDSGAVEIRDESDEPTAKPTEEELNSEVAPTTPDPTTIEDPAMKVENENDNY